MTRIAGSFVAMLLLVALAHSVAAQTPTLPEQDQLAIRAVVSAQLQAFQRNDGEAAFSYASPMIRRMFGTSQVFMDMVRQGYRPVYRPRDVQFQDIVQYRGQPTQTVYIVGPDGQSVVALYQMQKQSDGSWKINGCILTPSEDQQT